MCVAKGKLVSRWNHIGMVLVSFLQEWLKNLVFTTQGELLGLLHDLGKYSTAFQSYIQSATGLLNQDEDEEFVDAAGLKGKIDHSTSGAQWVWQELAQKDALAHIAGQIMALCIASHHSGLKETFDVQNKTCIARLINQALIEPTLASRTKGTS